MTTAANINSIIGYPYAGNANNTTDGGLAVEVATATSGYVPRIAVGTEISVIDPYWGGMTLVRLKIATGTSLSVGNVVTWDHNFQAATLAGSAANTAQYLAFSNSFIPSNATHVQYAWFQISGTAPVLSTGSVGATSKFFSSATAGKLTGTITGGQQIVALVSRATSATTVVKANTTTQSGSTVLRLSVVPDGWFVGLPLSGTGIAASTTITGIDADNRTVTMNNAATASGSVTVTGTYNDGGTNHWNIGVFNRCFQQGQIT